MFFFYFYFLFLCFKRRQTFVIHFKISFPFIHTSIVESMCYFVPNHHADPAIIKISESEKESIPYTD